MQVFTIGHSTLPFDAFAAALEAYAISLVADVRRFPASRRYPQYNGAILAAALDARGIGYLHLTPLGGRRQARPDSRNTAWRNASFRGYADHMESEEYQQARRHLLEEAKRRRTAIMCAEKLWWQCHRSLIADDVKASGHEVTHILSPERSEPHPYTAAARIVEGRLSYGGLLP